MALLLLAAMLTPLMPAIELDLSWADVTSKSSSSSSGGNSYSWTYIDVFDDGHNTVYTDNVDRINISGDGYIHADNANITVEGDYYISDFQFNPHVGEIWAGNNNKAWSAPCLYNDGSAMLDKATMSALLRHNNYAILYEGFMDLESRGPYKPEGATRAGEILGYDIYARRGEFFREADGDIRREDGGILTPTSNVSSMWAIINTYRAVGVELRNVNAKVYNRWVEDDRRAIAAIRGREWDINGSPVVGRLTGNLIATYDGDAKPVIEAYVSRTDPKLYLDRFTQVDRMSWVSNMPTANELTGEVNADADSKYITLGEFCVLVQHMMETYGEPVIIDQEKLMLLEAYGRVMPHYLSPIQYDAVEYLMCRGIITETDMPWTEWVTFEDATEILMRVKDVDSRHTFKQIQLTTDVSMLEQGYYPTDVGVTTEEVITAEAVDVQYERAKSYDYFVELNADTTFHDKNGNSVQPYVCESKDGYAKPLENAVYLGVYDFGSSKYYRFQVPIGAQSDGRVWINTTDPDGDKPGQLSLEYGGGWYHSVEGSTVHGANDSIWLSRTNFSPSDAILWVDSGRFSEAAQKSLSPTADTATPNTFLVKIPTYVMSACTKGEGGPMWDASKNDKQWDVTGNGIGVEFKRKDGGFYYFNVTGVASESEARAFFRVDYSKVNSSVQNAEGNDTKLFGVSPAFAKKGNTFLVSTEYLKAEGILKQFTPLPNKRYYASFATRTAGDTGASYFFDVYINLGGDYPTVCVGSQATIYPEGYTLVKEKLGGEYYIDSSILSGKVKMGQDITASDGTVIVRAVEADIWPSEATPTGEGEHLQVRSPFAFEYGSPSNSTVLTLTKEVGGTEYAYLFAASTYIYSNWVVLEDMRNGLFQEGTNPVATLFTLYETGEPSTVDDGGARETLEDLFSVKLGSDSIRVYQYSVQPRSEVGHTLYRSEKGDLYIRIPAMTKGVDWADSATIGSYLNNARNSAPGNEAYTLPLRYVRDGDKRTIVSLNHNVAHKTSAGATGWFPVALGKRSNRQDQGDPLAVPVQRYYDLSDIKVIEDLGGQYGQVVASEGASGTVGYSNSYTLRGPHAHSSNVGCSVNSAGIMTRTSGCTMCGVASADELEVKYAVCGAASLLTRCATSWGDVSKLRPGDKMYMYLGSSRVYMPGTGFLSLDDQVRFDKNKDTTAYLIHVSGSTTYLQCTAFDFTETDNTLGSKAKPEKPTYGESNKITDWLLWLKAAKLSDAEDILTICIVAVLNWLPRLFMALFLLLMCLAMIANVKPWASFCDKVFDPYKFLTGGRQTVHTINIKTTFLWSMIALALFGLFQNGLILELIAWIVRAVVGIMNR